MTRQEKNEIGITGNISKHIQRRGGNIGNGIGKQGSASLKPPKKLKKYKHLVFRMGDEEFTL